MKGTYYKSTACGANKYENRDIFSELLWPLPPIVECFLSFILELEPLVQSPDLTHPSEGFLPEGHDILSVFFQLTMIRKHFQKIFPNVDLRLEGAGGDWSHHSGLGCLPPPGSTESTRNSKLD